MTFVSAMPLAQACLCELPSGVDLLEQPGHVLAEGLHGSEGLFVLLDVALDTAGGRRETDIRRDGVRGTPQVDDSWRRWSQ